MKKFLMAVLALAVILVALVLLHPVWIGPVVRTAVSKLAPKYLGVPARLDGFSLNAYTGRLTIDGFALDNPPGCPEAKFVTVGHLCVDVNPMTVLSDRIVVEEISVRDLFVSLVTDERKVYNYETVAAVCSSSDSKGMASDAKPAEREKTDAKPAPKVVIDLVQVQNALVKWQQYSLPLPSFRLTGIGRATDGVEFEAAWKEMESKFLGSLGPLAKGLQTALSQTQGTFDEGMKTASELGNSVDDTKQAPSNINRSKLIKDSVDTLKSLFK